MLVGHLVSAKEEVYRALAERLNRNPVGAPVNPTLMEILYRLYTETEAMVGSKFPLLPVPLEQLVDATGMKREELEPILDHMANKGLVIDIPRRDSTYYMLAPMVIGFFEYTFMRVREDLDMKELAELFEQYFLSPGIRQELGGGETKMFHTLVYESLIPAALETEVLDYERASAIIRQSGGGALSLCSCRHKASHLGKACRAPVEVCTALGSAGQWVARRGLGRPATVDELLRVLDQTEKLGLVHLGDNVLKHPAYICHCCGCCCQALRAIREAGETFAHPSNFIPTLDPNLCEGCGTCADSCHINAISMEDGENGAEVPHINREVCLGCGVCAASCPNQALTMSRRQILHVPPQNKKEQMFRIAIEKGRTF